jgi:hypothetical protein
MNPGGVLCQLVRTSAHGRGFARPGASNGIAVTRRKSLVQR